KIKFDGLASALLPQSNCSFEDGEEQRTCGFFKWVDEIGEVGELQMLLQEKDSKIAKLEQEMEELKQKVKRLKVKKEKLQDEVGEMGIATTETLFEMKEKTLIRS
ncbi:Exostosin-3, partial [Bienertia sinuspersici]